jgi:hypothetical protein
MEWLNDSPQRRSDKTDDTLFLVHRHFSTEVKVSDKNTDQHIEYTSESTYIN